MIKRLNEIINIVNTTIPINSQQFKIKQKQIKSMFKQCNQQIFGWKGIDLNFIKTEKKSYKEYKRASTNWFNRNKPKIYGNFFFYPLIFIHILQVWSIFHFYLFFFFLSQQSQLIRNIFLIIFSFVII